MAGFTAEINISGNFNVMRSSEPISAALTCEEEIRSDNMTLDRDWLGLISYRSRVWPECEGSGRDRQCELCAVENKAEFFFPVNTIEGHHWVIGRDPYAWTRVTEVEINLVKQDNEICDRKIDQSESASSKLPDSAGHCRSTAVGPSHGNFQFWHCNSQCLDNTHEISMGVGFSPSLVSVDLCATRRAKSSYGSSEPIRIRDLMPSLGEIVLWCSSTRVRHLTVRLFDFIDC